MDPLSARFARREFLAGAMLELRDEIECCNGGDPLWCIRYHNRDVLVAVVEAQLQSLWGGAPDDDPHAIVEDVLRFIECLDVPVRKALCAALVLVDFHSRQTTGQRLSSLGVEQRKELLNQGESPHGAGRPPPITWDDDFLLHTAISGVTMVTRLVISSRWPARRLAGLTWSAPCMEPANLAHVPPPAYADLGVEYDVCIVGSGVGGAVVAARAAEAGKRVLIVEAGNWISPHEMIEMQPNPQGGQIVTPSRGDSVVMRLYKDAGVQLAGNLPTRSDSSRMRLLGAKRRLREIQPVQTVNVIQAKVVGGGPYINNAIHLEIEEDAWNSWDAKPPGVTYADFRRRMDEVKRDLGVNTDATRNQAGARSLRFIEGCRQLGLQALPLPVSILPQGTGCGSDNSVDSFGDHTNGVHPFRPNGPNSYFMRALHAKRPAAVAYRMRAIRFELSVEPSGRVRVERLLAEDRREKPIDGSGPTVAVRARQFVLAAGVIASTNILAESLRSHGLSSPGLGERFTGNVVMPIYAIYDKPLPIGGDVPEPGITQCYFTKAEKRLESGRSVLVEPAIENWFHYPGTIEAVWTGWFDGYAEIVRAYNHTAIAGMVVPSKVRPENRIKSDGQPVLEVDDEEFDLLLRGIERIGRIFLAAGTADNGVTISIPTKGLMLDADFRPLHVRSPQQLQATLADIRRRGPAFLQLATAHPQGGNSLGRVVDPASFRVQLADQRRIDNLMVADASILPAGCGVNPQLTLHALAHYAADALLAS
jgi:choline dehydrogenase-like flavoprotein